MRHKPPKNWGKLNHEIGVDLSSDKVDSISYMLQSIQKSKPSLTCLEEAKKENDLTEIELCRARTLEQHWYHKYSKLQMRSLYYLLAVALICFVGGIFFAWKATGEPIYEDGRLYTNTIKLPEIITDTYRCNNKNGCIVEDIKQFTK